jgi:hypothetical protein
MVVAMLTNRIERAFQLHPWRVVVVGGIVCGGVISGVGLLVVAATTA